MKELLLGLLFVLIIIGGVLMVTNGSSTPHCVQTATGNTDCSNSPSGGYGPDFRDNHKP